MLDCQLADASLISVLCNGLKGRGGVTNHMGIVHVPAGQAFSYAKKHRKREIFADAYFAALSYFRERLTLYGLKSKSLNLKKKIKIVDSHFCKWQSK